MTRNGAEEVDGIGVVESDHEAGAARADLRRDDAAGFVVARVIEGALRDIVGDTRELEGDSVVDRAANVIWGEGEVGSDFNIEISSGCDSDDASSEQG